MTTLIGNGSPKNENSVINLTPSCHSKPVRPLFIVGEQRRFFMKSESFLTLDSNVTDMFKAQKGSKDIVKIVHVTSVVQP